MTTRDWLSAACALTLVATFPSFADEPRIDLGRQLAQENCSRCHAIGRAGKSPHAPAPPFRTLHERYNVEDLQEALAEGIFVGHPEMPRFQLSPAQIESFIEYLKSLER